MSVIQIVQLVIMNLDCVNFFPDKQVESSVFRIPSAEFVVFDSENIQYFSGNMVDRILECIGMIIKSQHRWHDNRTDLG